MEAVKRGVRGSVQVRVFLDSQKLMADKRYRVRQTSDGVSHYFNGFYISGGGTLRFFSIDSHNGGFPAIFDPFVTGFSIKKTQVFEHPKTGRYFGKRFGSAIAEIEHLNSEIHIITVEGENLQNVLDLYDAILDQNQKWQEVSLEAAEESYEAIEKAERRIKANKEAGYWKRLWLALLGR